MGEVIWCVLQIGDLERAGGEGKKSKRDAVVA